MSRLKVCAAERQPRPRLVIENRSAILTAQKLLISRSIVAHFDRFSGRRPTTAACYHPQWLHAILRVVHARLLCCDGAIGQIAEVSLHCLRQCSPANCNSFARTQFLGDLSMRLFS